MKVKILSLLLLPLVLLFILLAEGYLFLKSEGRNNL
jgi:hypothetical protein